MQAKDEKIFRYIKARMAINFTQTWTIIFDHFSAILIPLLLLLAYLQRAVAYFG